MMASLLLFILLSFSSDGGAQGQSTDPGIINPSGSCGVDTSDGAGSRPGYSYSSSGTTYVPDCNNPLQREYWRVFVPPDGDGSSAYVIPRPDDTGIKYEFCCDDDDLCELFKKNGLCGGDDIVQIINSIPLDEALIMMNKLHEKLVFRAEVYDEDTGGITPWAPDDDILEICDTGMTNDANVLDHCSDIRARCNDQGECLEYGIIPSGETVKALTPLLNELYGIEKPNDYGGLSSTPNGKKVVRNGVSSSMPSFVLFAWTVFVAVASKSFSKY